MKRGLLIILIALTLFPLASGDIYINGLKEVYNVGDIVEAEVTLSSSVYTSGFFKSYLVCGVNEIETYRSIERIDANEEKVITVRAIIDNNIIGDLIGECYLRATYGSGEVRSQSFRISRGVHISIDMNDITFSPGDSVSMSGRVVKDNGEPLNGFITILVEGINVKVPSAVQEQEDNEIIKTNDSVLNEFEKNETFENDTETDETVVNETSSETNDTIADETESETNETEIINENQTAQAVILGSVLADVVDGVFSASFVIADNAPPGTYRVNARAYDLDVQGVVMSSGESFKEINVLQVIRDIGVTFNSDSIVPGNDFWFTPLLYDQAGNYGEGDVAVRVYMPDKTLFLEKLMRAGETNSVFIGLNYTPGFWSVNASTEELEITKSFFVEELRKLDSRLEEGRLIITNIGNVPYNGFVEIFIGNKSEIRVLNLTLGESKSFKLGAPDGAYDILFNDGDLHSLGSAFLTGKVIGIDEESVGSLFGNFWVWIWALVIAIIFVVVMIFLRKFLRERSFSKVPKMVMPSGKTVSQPLALSAQKASSAISGAGGSMDSGVRQEASIVTLKIKNIAVLNGTRGMDSPMEVIEDALSSAKSSRAKIYVDDDYRLVIFIPLITKERDNDMKAINVAKQMAALFERHNKSSAYKIEFGIGVHSGQLAVESKDKNIKFVSMDNTIVIAKRVAESSNGNILLSDNIHRKVLGKIRAEKIAGTNFWQLKKFVDREDYSDFVQKFLNKQKSQ